MRKFLAAMVLTLLFPTNGFGEKGPETCVFAKHCSHKNALCIAKKCINPGTKEYCSATLSNNKLTILGHLFSKTKKMEIIRKCWSCAKQKTIRCTPKGMFFLAVFPKGGGSVQLNAHGFTLYIDGRRILPKECTLSGLIRSNLTMVRFHKMKPYQMFSSKSSSKVCNQCNTKKKKPAFCIPRKCTRIRGRYNEKGMTCIPCKPKDDTCNKWPICTKVRCP